MLLDSCCPKYDIFNWAIGHLFQVVDKLLKFMQCIRIFVLTFFPLEEDKVQNSRIILL